MDALPLVSIGILSYNRPDDLRRAIESAINQSYRNLEIIISDNGSLDQKCAEIIWKYAKKDTRIKPYLQEVNRGVHFNLKFVMEVATGEYFCWLAGDDAIAPDNISESISLLLKNETLACASCMPAFLDSVQDLSFKFLPNTSKLDNLKEKYALILNHTFTDRNLFYYGVFKLRALKNCSKHFLRFYGSDLMLLLEITEYGDIGIIEKKEGYLYQTHEGQISANSLQYRKNILGENASFLKKHTFFTAYIYHFAKIIWQDKRLSIPSKLSLNFQIFRLFIKSNRYHLIKYDIGIDQIVAKFKGRG